MQSEYQCQAEAWEKVVERIQRSGLIVTRPQLRSRETVLEIKSDPEQMRGIWLFAENAADAKQPSQITVSMHWLVRNPGQDKKALMRIAIIIEGILFEEGALCISDPVNGGSQ